MENSPPIPKKLKAYRAQDIRTEKTVGWQAKGIKYDKKKIDELEKAILKSEEPRQ